MWMVKFRFKPIEVYGKTDTGKYRIIKVDDDGNVLISNIDSMDIVNQIFSITSSENTSGLEGILQVDGRSIINIYYSVSDAATIDILVSNDGTNWYLFDSITTSSSKSEVLQYPFMSWRFIKVKTTTTGIDVTFEITASR